MLFVTSRLSSGGAERVVSRLINYSKDKIDSTVLIFEPNVSYKVDCRIFVAQKRSGPSLLNRLRSFSQRVMSIRKMVETDKPDAIMATTAILPFSIYVALSSRKIRIKCIQRSAVDPVEVLHSKMTRKDKILHAYDALVTILMANQSQVVFPSKSLLAKYRKFSPIPLPNGYAIRNFVDAAELSRLASEEVSEWPQEPVIVTVGRLDLEKNHALLIRAFAKARNVTKCKLFILGEGPLRLKLVELAQSLNVSDHVVFFGLQKNPFKFTFRSKVFVLSSDAEGMPNSLLEAMALGVPVIATDTEGSVEVIGEREPAGIIVPRNNEDELTKAILAILNDDKLQAYYSERSKERAREFSPDNAILQYVSLFQKVKDR